MVSSNATGLAAGCIAITGGKAARRGALYGVYHLLNAWGFRFFAPTETVAPSAAAIAAAAGLPIDVRYGPKMELRTAETYETNGGGDPEHTWQLRSRGNECDDLPAGGCMVYAAPPGSVHTSYNLLADGAGETSPGR